MCPSRASPDWRGWQAAPTLTPPSSTPRARGSTRIGPARAPRWLHVDVELVEKTRLLTLAEMRSRPELTGMLVLRRGNRLSITPLQPTEWDAVLALLGTP